MAAHVLVEAGAACKRSVADETREWMVTGVNGCRVSMHKQGTGRCKPTFMTGVHTFRV